MFLLGLKNAGETRLPYREVYFPAGLSYSQMMHELFIEDPQTGRIRLTRTAHERYGAKFARVGYDTRNIRTKTEFEAAVDASFAYESRKLAETARGQDPLLDKIMKGFPGWN